MSRLEFVAIQFGVQFTSIYNLWRYVDKVCQRYLPFQLISKTLLFAKLFHDFILFYFILFYFILFYFIPFPRSFYIIPYMDLRP